MMGAWLYGTHLVHRTGLILCLLPLSVGMLHAADEQEAGAWTPVSVKSKEILKATLFAIIRQQRVMADNGQKEKLSLVKIKSAQQQVVAGMNYFLTMQVRVGDEEKTAEAIGFMQPWRNKVELTSWKFIEEPANQAADDHSKKDD